VGGEDGGRLADRFPSKLVGPGDERDRRREPARRGGDVGRGGDREPGGRAGGGQTEPALYGVTAW